MHFYANQFNRKQFIWVQNNFYIPNNFVCKTIYFICIQNDLFVYKTIDQLINTNEFLELTIN